MPKIINPQLSLRLEPTEPDDFLDDSVRSELVEALANLILLFVETANNETILSGEKNQ